jgi:hypothetical protein
MSTSLHPDKQAPGMMHGSRTVTTRRSPPPADPAGAGVGNSQAGHEPAHHGKTTAGFLAEPENPPHPHALSRPRAAGASPANSRHTAGATSSHRARARPDKRKRMNRPARGARHHPALKIAAGGGQLVHKPPHGLVVQSP